MKLQASEITVRTDADSEGIDLRVSRLEAAFRFDGDFTQRTLVVERLALSGVRVRARGGAPWETLMRSSGPGGLAGWVANVLFFRNLRFDQFSLTEAGINWRTGGRELALSGLTAAGAPDGVQVGGSARIAWPAADASLEASGFSAALTHDPSTEPGLLTARAHLPSVRTSGSPGSAEAVAAEVRLELAVGPERVAISAGEAQCLALKVARRGSPDIALSGLRLNAAGDFDRRRGVLTLERWSAAAQELMELSGAARVKLSAPRDIRLSLGEGRLFPANLIAAAGRRADGRHLPVGISGPVALTGTLDLRDTASGWVEDGHLTAAFDQNEITAVAGPTQLVGLISGRLRIAGRLSSPALSAEFSGRRLRVSSGGQRIGPLAVDATVEGIYPSFSLAQAEVRVPSAAVPVGGWVVPFNDLVLRLQNGVFDAERVTISLPDIRLTADRVRELNGALRGNRNEVAFSASADDVGLAAAGRMGLLPTGWRLSAGDRFKINGVWRFQGETHLSATIDVDRAEFADALESRLGEGVSLRTQIDVTTQRRGREAVISATARAAGGELLWDGVYMELGRNPVDVSTRLLYTAHDRQLTIADARLTVENLITLQARGRIARDHPAHDFSLELAMPAAPLAPLFGAFVADPLRHSNPGLAGLQVDGEISGDLNAAAGNGRRVLRGRVGWNSGRLATPSGGVRLEGIDLDLPLWHQAAGEPAEGPAVGGRVAIRRILLPGLPDQGLDLPLSAHPDRLTAGPGARLLFPAGEIRLDAIECRDWLRERPRVRTALRAERVQVGHFLKGLWSEPVSAVLNGSLEQIEFDGRDLRSQGILVAELFGGRILVENPGVNSLLGAAPALGADFRVEGVNLSALTQGTAFGRIQGVLEGFINEVEIVKGQPQRFDLKLETVRRPGIPQRITVEAVENIARIGGGQSPFVGLAGHFASLFREFVYAKMGIRAVLENDQFRINGTIAEGGVEYIVRKGGVPGVDVVNLNPANQISFKDMVKRVQRLAEPGAGPVVR